MPINSVVRILCNGFHWFEAAGAAVDREHSVVRVSAEDIRRAWERPSPDWYRALVPDGWEPDVALFCCPEYHVLPPFFSRLPCPVALWVGDWYMNPSAVLQLAPLADVVLADAVGVRRLGTAGVANVEECCPWTFDPALHRPDWDAEPLHDVSFVGNLSWKIQAERNRWVERLLRLPDDYRATVTAGIYDEDYAAFLRRSRISFNRSVTGDVNMRCFEAPACGSLLLVERENAEIGRWFRPGEECVLYGDDDFEDVIAYYLDHEDERAAIARAGWERVQEHAPAPRLRELIDRLGDLAQSGITRSQPRPATEASATAFQALHRTVDEKAYGGVEMMLEQGERDSQADGGVLVNRAALYLLHAESQPPDTQRDAIHAALDNLARAAQADPADAVARLNRAALAQLVGATEIARAVYVELLKDLEAGRAAVYANRLLYPQELSPFMMAWFEAALDPDPDAKLSQALAAEVAERLADITDSPAHRAALYQRAVVHGAAPTARAKLASLLLAHGAQAEGIAQLEQLIGREPLMTWIWESYVTVLRDSGQPEAARVFAEDRARLLARSTVHRDAAARLLEIVPAAPSLQPSA